MLNQEGHTKTYSDFLSAPKRCFPNRYRLFLWRSTSANIAAITAESRYIFGADFDIFRTAGEGGNSGRYEINSDCVFLNREWQKRTPVATCARKAA